MSTELDPFGGPVQVGSVTLKTPGLTGTAAALPQGSSSMRSAQLSTDELDEALDNEHMVSQETIELVETAEIDVSAVPTRSTAYDEPASDKSSSTSMRQASSAGASRVTRPARSTRCEGVRHARTSSAARYPRRPAHQGPAASSVRLARSF
jgi:hypothetical protein